MRTTPAQRAAFTVGNKITICTPWPTDPISDGKIVQDFGDLLSVKTNMGVVSAQRRYLHNPRNAK